MNENFDAAEKEQSWLERKLTVKNIEAFKDSCPVTAVTHGAIGFVFGSLVGLFFAGIGSSEASIAASSLPLKMQVKSAVKEMGSRSLSSGKNFAIIGSMFSTSECVLESFRGRKDYYNTAMSGCLTGGILASKGGPKATLIGCGGFAAFSTAIEYFLQEK